MSAVLVQRALRRSLAQIRYVSAVQPEAAEGLVAAVYAQMEREFGMLAPPVALHSPAPRMLAACWVMLRETLLARGRASRPAKEVVAAAVSLGNTCPYCVAVHNAVLGGLAHRRDARFIATGDLGSIEDPALRDLAVWACSSGQREAAARRPPPFPAGHLAELAGVAVTFHYLNRMVTLFLQETPLPPGVPNGLARGLMRMLGRLLRSAAVNAPEPGAALPLLAEAAMPGDLHWAAGNSAIADGFARAIAAIDAAGARAVPEAVRELVLGELAAWDGRPRGPSRTWADAAVRGLRPADRPAGRIALLTAFAPYQVLPADIEAFRRGQFADQDLVELTSWASLAAARRVGTWLGEALNVNRPGQGSSRRS